MNEINESLWYQRICNHEELNRILNPQNAQDYILKISADTIADNSRFYRVFLRMARCYKEKWSLENYLSCNNYADIFNLLSPENKNICRNIAGGSIISNDPNGYIFETEYGICTTISRAVTYFSRFASLALLDFDGVEVPFNVRLNAMRIAIRVMLQKESMDFQIDPRGIIPQEFKKTLVEVCNSHINFIIAHEYAHAINGDLDRNNKKPIFVLKAHFKDETDYKKLNGYNSNQTKEFKADLGALNNLCLNETEYTPFFHNALLWFAMLSIFEAAENYIFPPYDRQTHPGAKARYQNIIDNARRPINFSEDLYINQIPEMINFWEKIILKDVEENFDLYEMYGSVYLGEPNTEWRGPELIDRVDY